MMGLALAVMLPNRRQRSRDDGACASGHVPNRRQRSRDDGGFALAVMCPIGGNGAGMMGLAFAIVTETAKMDPKTTL